MSIEIMSPTDSRWRRYLNTVKHDFYHLPGYLELEAKRCEAVAEAILIEDGEKSFFLPYLIRDCRKISDGVEFDEVEIYDVVSPYGYSGMLLDTPERDLNFIKQCWISIHQHWQSQNVCSAFLRLHSILNEDLELAIEQIDSNVVCNRSEIVICDLNYPLDELLQQFRRNHRTKIDKLKKSGFKARMVPIELYLDKFIDIYHETMQRVNASSNYFFDKSYFEALVSALGDRIYLFVVELEDKIAAAILITEFSGIVQYHLSGTKTEFLSQSPNTILFSYIIEWGKNRCNNRYLNLGGGLGGQRDSLYHFKAGFSKQTKTFATIGSIVDRDRYDHLLNLRAKALNITVDELKDSAFFPVYRSK
jgi:Acetyltransferase (GNAT) domain